jgi:hypothetical protein
VISYALSLSDSYKEAFLVVVCAVCWSIWTLCNKISFQNGSSVTNRNLIILICSLVNYWAGNFSVGVAVKNKLKFWLPDSMDMIPFASGASSTLSYHTVLFFLLCACYVYFLP